MYWSSSDNIGVHFAQLNRDVILGNSSSKYNEEIDTKLLGKSSRVQEKNHEKSMSITISEMVTQIHTLRFCLLQIIRKLYEEAVGINWSV